MHASSVWEASIKTRLGRHHAKDVHQERFAVTKGAHFAHLVRQEHTLIPTGQNVASADQESIPQQKNLLLQMLA